MSIYPDKSFSIPNKDLQNRTSTGSGNKKDLTFLGLTLVQRP